MDMPWTLQRLGPGVPLHTSPTYCRWAIGGQETDYGISSEDREHRWAARLGLRHYVQKKWPFPFPASRYFNQMIALRTVHHQLTTYFTTSYPQLGAPTNPIHLTAAEQLLQHW